MVTDDVTFVYFISILSEIPFIECFIKVVIIMFLLFSVPPQCHKWGVQLPHNFFARFAREIIFFFHTEIALVPPLTATHLIARLGELNLRLRATRARTKAKWTYIRK